MSTASTGDTTSLTMLVLSFANPVDFRVYTDDFVHRVNQDDFEPLVDSVLEREGETQSTGRATNRIHPVAVQHTQIAQFFSSTTFGNRPQTSHVHQVVNTSSSGLAISDTLGNRSFSATSSHPDTINDVSLLAFVTKTSCFIGP